MADRSIISPALLDRLRAAGFPFAPCDRCQEHVKGRYSRDIGPGDCHCQMCRHDINNATSPDVCPACNGLGEDTSPGGVLLVCAQGDDPATEAAEAWLATEDSHG